MSTFTGDVTKLVAAPMLQDFLIDKDGTPMSGGTVTMYHDNSRTTLKNWYYQSGTPGNYTYITLPNPLTLSAAGTICDINGVDTIPFYYPWSETDETVHDPYYVTIINHAQTNQITRANFPFEGEGGGGGGGVDTFNNLVINAGFWRNFAPNALNVTPFTTITYNSSNNMSIPTAGPAYSLVVAPSQHDGFRYPDIQFLKNNLTGTDKVTFTPFPSSTSLTIPNTVTPEYYVSHVCSSPGTGETQKCYQFPLSLHLNTLANVPFSFSIQAQNDPTTGSTASGANVIEISIFQDTGTGGTPAPTPVPIMQITLNSTWQTYTVASVFPSTAGLVLSGGNDDAFYLQVQMPLNKSCGINFTKPSIYLTENGVIPTNDFQTYDQVDTIINNARTGDLRTSLNRFYYYGWVPMTDGSVGNSLSNATSYGKVDAWPLFNLIWGLFKNYDLAGVNILAQMFSSAHAPVAYGASAIDDWNANKAISLTKSMGRVILGTATTLPGFYDSAFTSNANLITTANTVAFFNGMPVHFIGTTHLLTTFVYFVTNFNGVNQFNVSNSFANAMAGNISTFANDSGTVQGGLQGSFEGEYAHTPLSSEVAINVPVATGTINTQTVTLGAGVNVPGGVGTTWTNGAAKPFNVTQPGTFYNIFIKL